MKRSSKRILTTHVGALPGPVEAWSGEGLSDDQLGSMVRDVVAKQRAAGIDIVNEGELTKGGNWVAFINSRLSGFEPGQDGTTFALLGDSDDWKEFSDFYQKALEGGTLFEQTRSAPIQTNRRMDWVCREPIRYTGQTALQREIDLLRSALGSQPPGDAFITTTAPASIEVGRATAEQSAHLLGSAGGAWGFSAGSPNNSSRLASTGAGSANELRVAVKPIMRPAKMTATQMTRERVATILPTAGADGDRSQR
jgi:hypothetical protein